MASEVERHAGLAFDLQHLPHGCARYDNASVRIAIDDRARVRREGLI
jgi:hypothetical protein